MLFAMGRRGLIDPRVGVVHSQNQTPALAVASIGVATAACMFLGDAILVPISEVGSVACATGWLAACASYYCMKPPPLQRAVAAIGTVLGLGMILMKIVPAVPGHFSIYEYIALGLWSLLGIGLAIKARRQ
jgi:amino acid transporter